MSEKYVAQDQNPKFVRVNYTGNSSLTNFYVQDTGRQAGARYTKSIVSLELRHKEQNNDPYSLHNNTIDFTQ